MNSTDQLLLERLPADDAVHTLIDRYSRLVYSASFRVLRDADLADDAVQSVFLTMVGRAHLLQRHVSLAGWLYVTSVRTSLAISRKESARKRRERKAYGATNQLSPEDVLAAEVVLAIHKLGNVDREVVLLRYAQELSHEQIGQRLNLSPDAVRMRCDRALRKLRQRLAGAELGVLLPTIFSLTPSTEPNVTKAIRDLKGSAPRGSSTWVPRGLFRFRWASVAAAFVPLAGIGIWVNHALLTGTPTRDAKGVAPAGSNQAASGTHTEPAQVWMAGDCKFEIQTYHGGHTFGMTKDVQTTNYGRSIDAVNWSPKANVLDAFFIPHLSEDGHFTVDVKSNYRTAEFQVISVKEQLSMPVLATYAPKSGLPFYVVLDTTKPSPLAKCYAGAADFKALSTDDVFEVTATPVPGRKEDKKFWVDNIASGPFGNTIVSARPAMQSYDVAVQQAGETLKTFHVQATNREPAHVSFLRPVGIQCHGYVTLNRRSDGTIDSEVEYWEFTDPNTPNPTPQSSFTGHGARFGMSSENSYSVGSEFLIRRSTSQPHEGLIEEGHTKDIAPSDLVFRFTVTASR